MSAEFRMVAGPWVGQIAYVAADGTTYIGDVCGNPGPVYVQAPGMRKQLVRNPERFGKRFNADWCRKFEEAARPEREETEE